MKTLKNAMRSLAIIVESPDPVSVAEIGRKLGLPRSSASRLMASLRDGGLVEQDPRSRRYVAGELAWRLGMRHRPSGYDIELVSECMLNITATTGFTTWMAVLTGVEIVLLRQNQGNTPTQFSVRLGQTLPAHATAVGKAMLSRLPDRTIMSLYGSSLPQVTAKTISTRPRLLDELARVRREKIAYSNQEMFPGVVSVGGAVFGAISTNPLGVSVSFPEAIGEPEKIATLLRSEFAEIGGRTGDCFWSERNSFEPIAGAKD